MKRFLWLCIRAELILLALALYWHHYIPKLVPYAKPQPSEMEERDTSCQMSPCTTTSYVWNILNDRWTCPLDGLTAEQHSDLKLVHEAMQRRKRG